MPSPIKHVILLMLENASCDRYLGYLSEEVYRYPAFEGIDPGKPARTNPDKNGKLHKQVPTALKQMRLDPFHEQKNVLTQLGNDNQGFVLDLEEMYKDAAPDVLEECRDNIMAYYPRGFLPAHHTLAEHFRPCDSWFSSVPGPTWPNRFFALSGRSNGLVVMPEKGWLHAPLEKAKMMYMEVQPTIFTRMLDAKKSFKVFYHDFPCSLVLWQNLLRRSVLRSYSRFNEFEALAAGDEKNFPEFVFIEPKYYGGNQNDDHPPHNIMKGQALIAKTYNAIRKNKALWESSLLVLLHDEHGGFYDHVIPPADAVNPDVPNSWDEYNFKQYGVRVPAILVSPYVKKGVEKNKFDHTSLLKFLKEEWGLADMGKRVDAATSINVALDLDAPPRQDCPTEIPLPTPEQLISDYRDLETDPDTSNPHHQASDLFKMLLIHDGAVAAIEEVIKKRGKLNNWEAIKAMLKSLPWSVLFAFLLEFVRDWFALTAQQKKALAESREQQVHAAIERQKLKTDGE